MIENSQALNELVEALRSQPRVAVDTEADSLHCYFEKLCLIQISVTGRDELVDPLAECSLQPLFDSLTAKLLILHGADYDLRLLRRAGFLTAAPVFDTMIAARLCGHSEFSLAALVQKFFGVTLVKGSQKANWARRPLTPQMIDYAMNDTRFLFEIADRLEAELRALGRYDWFLQSCEKIVASSLATREKDLENIWRISGSGLLRGRAAAILRALWHWRDAEARATDRPAFHILRNDALIEVAQRFDENQTVEIPHVKSDGRRVRFFEAARVALDLPQSEWPKKIRKERTRPTPDQEREVEALKQKRDRVAGQLNLDPSLIASRATLEGLVLEGEPAWEKLLPWQCALLKNE